MTEPTDAELLAEWDRVSHIADAGQRRLACLRAVLAKWGTPTAVAGEPVAGEPVAYLHDDGYWTAAKTDVGRSLNDRLFFAGSPKVAVYTAPQPTPAQAGVGPVWIVNDLGELGVQVNGRCFFLYKGDNIEYGEDDPGEVALHDDGSPMHYRIVGKREFGETCRPLAWILRGRSDHRYTQELVFTHGLSFGNPEDGLWRELPIPQPTRQGLRLGGKVVHQFRREHCSDWYDGLADHGDGGGPYEERTLYTAPAAPLTDEQIRAMCKEPWIFDTAKQWVHIVEAAHGIKGGQHGAEFCEKPQRSLLWPALNTKTPTRPKAINRYCHANMCLDKDAQHEPDCPKAPKPGEE